LRKEVNAIHQISIAMGLNPAQQKRVLEKWKGTNAIISLNFT
jgi:hypothetical protein